MAADPVPSVKQLILISRDDHQFPISQEIATISRLLSKKFLSPKSQRNFELLPLQMDAWTLKKILDWCQLRQDVVYSNPGLILALNQEDEEFFADLDANQLLALLQAAEELRIEPLAALIGQKIVNSIPESTDGELDAYIKLSGVSAEETEEIPQF